MEIKNELHFPSQQQMQIKQPIQQPMQNVQPILQQQPPQQQQQQEPVKVTPKISQLSELEQQLFKLHQKHQVPQQNTTVVQQQQAVPQQLPINIPQQQVIPSQMQQQQTFSTYSEAVRQSPTQQPQMMVQNSAPIAINTHVQNQQQQGIPQTPSVGSAPKVISRFSVSKVEEQRQMQQQSQQAVAQQPQILQSQTQQVIQRPPQMLSPEVEKNVNHIQVQQSQQQQHFQQQQPVISNMVQNIVSPMQQPVLQQPYQAQAFFQQHQGGVVSTIFC